MVSDPEEANIALPSNSGACVDFHFYYSVLLPNATITGLNPFNLWLTAYLFAILRLKLRVATQPPKTRYPVAGQPSGAGFTPA
ncbi:MAG: hypothetical protein D3912_04495 [Candidatus Electrothrix sp. AX1]|nr:hypothetical protein [Candidatus Electrothrix sp. AX1]